MGEHRAERLPVVCPVCHGEVEDDLRDHLLGDHSKEDLVDRILMYVEAEEEDGRAD